MKAKSAEIQIQRGFEFQCKGRLEDALSCYHTALRLDPLLHGVYNNMGAALQDLGRLTEALSCFEKAVRLKPDYVEAYNNMGNVLQRMGKTDDAISCYEKALEIRPDLSEVHNNIGNAYQTRGDLSNAVLNYQKALSLNPKNAQAYCNLGNIFQTGGKIDDAISCYQKAIQLNPNNPEAYTNMGAALKHRGELKASEKCHQKAIELRPDDAVAFNNLGGTFKHQGKIAEAITCYRKAFQIKPDYAEAHSNLLFAMHYDASNDAKKIYQESISWARRHIPKTLNKFAHHRPSAATNAKLKIGYVSPDFRSHSVSYFFLPLLKAHHRGEVEIFCYGEVHRSDEVTEQIKTLADQWRSTVGLSDDAVAQRIYEDGIQILVDLAGHTSNNRLLVFARRPAPIQITWLGYPGTTGLADMDYRITDALADPEGDAEPCHSETLIRLSGGFLCYAPPRICPNVSDLPAFKKNGVTFGSFNNLSKVNEQVIALWSQVLLRTPHASLVMKSKQLRDDDTKARYFKLFAEHGVPSSRIELLPAAPSTLEHLEFYSRIDIGLDPFPYNGTTTTCEALWMGVPVLTLKGKRHSSRVGTSILTRIGLEELVAVNQEAFIEKAIALSGDLDRLALLRKGMRQRLKESPLCNAAYFASSVENAFKKVWECYVSEDHQAPEVASFISNGREKRTQLAVKLEKGLKYHRSGQLDLAAETYRSILEIDPNQPDVLYFSGLLAGSRGKFREAVRFISRAIQICSDKADYYASLGDLFKNQNQTKKTILCYQQALQRNPDNLRLHTELGNIFSHQFQLEKAAVHYGKALVLRPDLAGTWYNMANVFKEQGRFQEAIDDYNRAIELDPDYADAWNNLGNVYKTQYRLQEAIEYYQKAVKLNPGFAQAYLNMAITLKDQGKIDEAMTCYKKALALKPHSPEIHSDQLLSMHYDPKYTPRALFDEARKWWQQYGKFLTPANPFKKHVTRERKLRIGYLSPDFRIHSVSFFFLPLLVAHDRTAFEIFCYSDVKRPDAMTARIKELSDHYFSVTTLPNDQLAEKICRDRIDILIDLAGHTGNNRLPVFARKPAPIQITWLGYPDTTGMPVMDYRLTDAIADPEGEADRYHTETLLRMKNGFLCYGPPEDAPEVSALPALKNGEITFGSFNNLPKMNDQVISAWSQILRHVPDASLLLKSKQFVDEYTRERYRNLFSQNEISSDRVTMLPRTDSVSEHLALYNRVDIGLDPFPYNGTTTTCEALWMGVPVVTLAGDHHCSRVGASILTRMGLEELIAANVESYVQKAVALAADENRLGQLRAGLRMRMAESPICDSKFFARSVEDIYRRFGNPLLKEK